MSDLLKHVEKMKNPAVVLQSVLHLTEKEWGSILKTAGILAKRLSEKVMPISVTFLDLLGQTDRCVGSDNGEHELAPSSVLDPEIKPECYMCVHCLEKFTKAENYETTFFPGGRK